MPRRELVAALLGAEFASSLKDALHDLHPEVFLWTDAVSVQRWLANDSLKLEAFVLNRVSKILTKVEARRCKWLRGTENGTDQLSRGIRPKEVDRWEHYAHGPAWLTLPEEFWPVGPSKEELFVEEEVGVDEVAVFVTPMELETVEPQKDHVMLHLASHTNSFNTLLRSLLTPTFWRTSSSESSTKARNSP